MLITLKCYSGVANDLQTQNPGTSLVFNEHFYPKSTSEITQVIYLSKAAKSGGKKCPHQKD